MIALEPHAEGTIVPVKAHAAARRNAIHAGSDGALHVSVTTAPEKGKANKAIIALLATALALRKSQVELVAGATSSNKRFLIRGLDVEALKVRLENVLAIDS